MKSDKLEDALDEFKTNMVKLFGNVLPWIAMIAIIFLITKLV